MKYRAFVFEDDEGICKILEILLKGRGYEVFIYNHPSKCSILNSPNCECDPPLQCADIILFDRYYYGEDCMDLLKKQKSRNCNAKFMGIMSAALSHPDEDWAEENDVKLLKKPFVIDQLPEWLDYCEANIEPNRKLTEVA